MASKTRPTGVTILVILEVLTGLFGVLGGLGLLALGFIAGLPMGELPWFMGIMVGIFGFAVLVFGIISFALAYGLWNGRSWAWIWSLIFAVIGAIFAILPMLGGSFSEIVQLIIAAIIIYYLTRPYVKTYFGKT